MTSSYLPDYIPNDAFQIRSHSGVLGVRTSTCVFWGKMQFDPNSPIASLGLSFFICRPGTKIPHRGIMRNKQEDMFNMLRIVFET